MLLCKSSLPSKLTHLQTPNEHESKNLYYHFLFRISSAKTTVTSSTFYLPRIPKTELTPRHRRQARWAPAPLLHERTSYWPIFHQTRRHAETSIWNNKRGSGDVSAHVRITPHMPSLFFRNSEQTKLQPSCVWILYYPWTKCQHESLRFWQAFSWRKYVSQQCLARLWNHESR